MNIVFTCGYSVPEDTTPSYDDKCCATAYDFSHCCSLFSECGIMAADRMRKHFSIHSSYQ